MDKFKSKVKNILDKLYESSDMRVKYPRTYHMPFSEALASDDKFVDNPDLFDITPVEQIYSGVYDENKILNSYKKYKSDHEGFVIRNSGSFKYDDFSKNVAKFVRKNHVQTDDHWMHSEIVPNKLKK